MSINLRALGTKGEDGSESLVGCYEYNFCELGRRLWVPSRLWVYFRELGAKGEGGSEPLVGYYEHRYLRTRDERRGWLWVPSRKYEYNFLEDRDEIFCNMDEKPCSRGTRLACARRFYWLQLPCFSLWPVAVASVPYFVLFECVVPPLQRYRPSSSAAPLGRELFSSTGLLVGWVCCVFGTVRSRERFWIFYL